MKNILSNNGNKFILIGLVLIISSFMYFGYNLWDDIRAGKSVNDALNKLKLLQVDEIQEYMLFPDMEMPTVNIDGINYLGELHIPTLELELPVISEENSELLRVAPCRYFGSAYNNTLVIAGHNYITHFGRINELSQNDEVIFTDVKGNTFMYKVCEIEVLNPENVNEMRESVYDLTLFTCTFGGKYRVTVRCEKVF